MVAALKKRKKKEKKGFPVVAAWIWLIYVAAKLGQAAVASATCFSCGGLVATKVHGGRTSSKNERRGNRERRAVLTQAAARAA